MTTSAGLRLRGRRADDYISRVKVERSEGRLLAVRRLRWAYRHVVWSGFGYEERHRSALRS